MVAEIGFRFVKPVKPSRRSEVAGVRYHICMNIPNASETAMERYVRSISGDPKNMLVVGVAAGIPSLLTGTISERTSVYADDLPPWSDQVLSRSKFRVVAFISASAVNRLVHAEYPRAREIAVRQIGHWAAQAALWRVEMHLVDAQGQAVLGDRSFAGRYVNGMLPDGLWLEDAKTGKYRVHYNRATCDAYGRNVAKLAAETNNLTLGDFETNRWFREAALAISAGRWDEFREGYGQTMDVQPAPHHIQGKQLHRIPGQRLPDAME